MIMPFLVFMPAMYTISETTVIGINFFKKPNWHILISGVSCITNILGNWILVPYIGAKGAAISTGFSYIVFFILRTTISLKYYKVNYGLKKMYAMLSVISLYAMYSTFKSDALINTVLGIIVFLLMIIIYFNDIKNIYNHIIKGFINKTLKKYFIKSKK